MAKYIVFHGDVIIHPGVYTWVDYSQVENILAGVRGIVAVIGEADEGEPNVVSIFSRGRDMIDYYKSGPLADIAYALFNPSTDPAVSTPFRVIAVKTNQSTAAIATLHDDTDNDIITVKARRYGTYGNTISIKVEAGSESGTKKITIASYDKTEVFDNISGALFSIQRSGGTLTVDDTGITASSGGTTEHIYPFDTYPTVQSVVADLQKDPNYTVSLLTGVETPSNVIDRATYDINTATIVRCLGKAVADAINAKSSLCTATITAYRIPKNEGPLMLTGGSVGTTSITDIQNALKSLEGLNIDFIVPLFDRDVGSLTFSSIINALVDHIKTCNATKSTAERQAFIGMYTTSVSNLKQQAIQLNSPYFALCGQRVKGVKADMSIAEMGVWYLAGILAGIKAGTPVGEPLTFKKVNIIDLVDTYNTQTIEDLLLNGIICVEAVPGQGFRIVKDLTTYLSTDNDILCSVSAMEAITYIKKGLRDNLNKFVGQKGLPRTISAIKSVLRGYLTMLATGYDAILMSTTDAQGNILPPFRNLEVSLSGDTLQVKVELTIVPGINYILNEVIPTKARM
jgi:hypothetical protein